MLGHLFGESVLGDCLDVPGENEPLPLGLRMESTKKGR